MKKKQVSLILPLYILCALLVLGLGASILFQESDIKEEHTIQPVTKMTQAKNKVVESELLIRDPALEYPESIEAELYLEENIIEDYVGSASRVFAEIEEALENSKVSSDIKPVALNIPDKVIPKPSFQINEETKYVIIIIDDMGISRKWSREVADLPGPLTLSYLPYAENLQAQADYAKKRGHHLMLHMPMEALGGKMLKTPGLLRVNSTQQAFLEKFNRNLNSFRGFSGVNNHMGSRLTQDRTKMTLVMKELKDHDLYFIDSKTIHDSVAADIAHEAGVPFAIRDVFLDHEDSREYVKGALIKLENKAKKNGVAIAIGHPKEATFTALKEWLPTLQDKNIKLIDAGQLIEKIYPENNISQY